MLQQPKKQHRYRITATLLNQWQRIFDAEDDVKESEKDVISYEDKVELVRKERYEEFIKLLNRISKPDTEAMRKGREYEKAVYDGLDLEFSPKVKGGAFQVTVTKNVDIDGVPITLYGVLDVLKAGRIYDIKRVGKYYSQKYRKSHQHPLYLYLVPEAIDFTYLACDDDIDSKDAEKRKNAHHKENYIRENCEDILSVVSQFLSWLRANDLFDTFTQKWIAY